MQQRRLVGGVAGLLTLAGVFALPFLNYTTTLWGIAYDFATDPTTGYADIFALEVIFILATVLLIIAGLTGVWPKASGILGLVGFALLMVTAYADSSSTTSFRVGDFDSGAYLILLATVVALVVGLLWRGKAQPAGQPMMQPTAMASPPPRRPAQSGSFCPNCGAPVGQGTKFCSSCGARLV